MKQVTGVYGSEVRNHLRAVEINECPLCGSDKGLDVGEVCGLPEIGPSAATVQNYGREAARSNLPVVPAMCLHCGYQFFFNAVKLGLTAGSSDGNLDRLQGSAFYLVRLNGEVPAMDVVDPESGEKRPAFYLWGSVAKLRGYLSESGTGLLGFSIVSFETVEDVKWFLEQHRYSYEWVVVNPQFGLPSRMEPFERLPEVARELAVEE